MSWLTGSRLSNSQVAFLREQRLLQELPKDEASAIIELKRKADALVGVYEDPGDASDEKLESVRTLMVEYRRRMSDIRHRRA